MYLGIRSSLETLKHLRDDSGKTIPRTEFDVPFNYTVIGIPIVSIPILILIAFFSLAPNGHWFDHQHLLITLSGTAYTLLASAILAAICAYFAGLVGSSLSPISGLALLALMGAAFLLLPEVSEQLSGKMAQQHDIWAASIAIMMTAIIASAGAISNDTMQDLKAGYMVGATPWKQQVMLMMGVVVAALVIPFVLTLLFEAYGLGGVFPRPGMDPNQMLLTPQATLMAAVVEGIFSHQLPWLMISTGAVIAIICIAIDLYLKKHGKGLTVLAVGLGIYLPFTASTPLILGGCLSHIVHKRLKRQKMNFSDAQEGLAHEKQKREQGLLLACGLVAGAAVMGVLLAIPFALKGSADALMIASNSFQPMAKLLSIAVTVGLCAWIIQELSATPSK